MNIIGEQNIRTSKRLIKTSLYQSAENVPTVVYPDILCLRRGNSFQLAANHIVHEGYCFLMALVCATGWGKGGGWYHQNMTYFGYIKFVF